MITPGNLRDRPGLTMAIVVLIALISAAVAVAQSSATNVTNHPARDEQPAWSPDDTRIAFATDRDGNFEIYSMNADGSGLVRLTEDPAVDRHPTWSPDGEKIAFQSYRNGNVDIYVMQADGGGVTRLTTHAALDLQPAWSPDGRMIAFVSRRDGNREIYAIDVALGNLTRLTESPGDEADPAWSPSGQRIAFSLGSSSEIHVMDADGGNLTRLTHASHAGGYDGAPTWSPDGEEVLFEASHGRGRAVYLRRADGEVAGVVVSDEEDFCGSCGDADGQPDWSATWGKIAYVSTRTLWAYLPSGVRTTAGKTAEIHVGDLDELLAEVAARSEPSEEEIAAASERADACAGAEESLGSLVIPLPASQILSSIGRWARYEIDGVQGSLPGGLTHLELSFPTAETVENRQAVWFQMDALSQDEVAFSMAMLVPSAEFLSPHGAEVEVLRYVLFPREGAGIEYISLETGQPVLPVYSFFRMLLPHVADPEDTASPFSERGSYMGHRLHRVAQGEGAHLLPVERARRLELSTTVLVGLGRPLRDTVGERLYSQSFYDADRRDRPTPRPRYAARDFSQADFDEMIDAGINYFNLLSRAQTAMIIDRPVYFTGLGKFGTQQDNLDKWPELLYRSNYRGPSMIVDEPAIRLMQGRAHFPFDDFGDHDDPAEAASDLLSFVGLLYSFHRLDPSASPCYMDALLREQGYDFGGELLRVGERPTWGFFASTSWYQFEAGAHAFISEVWSRENVFARAMKEKLGVDFPDDPEALLRFEHAYMTGASRHFGRPWGVSVYGHTTPAAAQRMFPMAYDQGATYSWFWNDPSDYAHVPYHEMLEIAHGLKRHVAQHPRQTPPGTPGGTRAAIALPWGYMFEQWVIHTGDAEWPDALWWSPHMGLQDDNGHGATYGDVLAAAGAVAARLIGDGTDFDFIYLREGEEAEGYDEVFRVLETGQVNAVPTAVGEPIEALPGMTVLGHNYPNPLNPGTVIPFDLVAESHVSLTIYDLLGQRVRTLVQGATKPGRHAVRWDGRDQAGRQVGTGVYVYRLVVGNHRLTRKLLVLK